MDGICHSYITILHNTTVLITHVHVCSQGANKAFIYYKYKYNYYSFHNCINRFLNSMKYWIRELFAIMFCINLFLNSFQALKVDIIFGNDSNEL